MATKKEYTCTRCDEKFHTGNWHCADGQRHVVELKKYYTSTQGLTLHYGPVHGEDVMSHSRGVLTFVKGTYQTTDPEQQEALDAYPGCIPCKQWEEINISAKEREAQSAREKVRLENTNNDLLAQLKKQQEELEALRKQAAKKA